MLYLYIEPPIPPRFLEVSLFPSHFFRVLSRMRTRARRCLCAAVSAVVTLNSLGVVHCEVSHSYPGAATRSGLHDAEMDPTQDRDRTRRPAAHNGNFGQIDRTHDKVSGMATRCVTGAADSNGTTTRSDDAKNQNATFPSKFSRRNSETGSLSLSPEYFRCPALPTRHYLVHKLRFVSVFATIDIAAITRRRP